MSTNTQVNEHLGELVSALVQAMDTVQTYTKIGSKLTSGNQTTELNKVRNNGSAIASNMQHAADCSICVN